MTGALRRPGSIQQGEAMPRQLGLCQTFYHLWERPLPAFRVSLGHKVAPRSVLPRVLAGTNRPHTPPPPRPHQPSGSNGGTMFPEGGGGGSITGWGWVLLHTITSTILLIMLSLLCYAFNVYNRCMCLLEDTLGSM